MMNIEKALFNSRDTDYRAPFGAVKENTAVLFRICLPRTLSCSGSCLQVAADSGNEEWGGGFSMFWAGMEGDDMEWWECHYAPPAADVYWYGFALDTALGRRYLVRLPDGRAALVEKAGVRWQLTCYDSDFTTPDWLAGGVMYQIFPDRFARSGEQKTGVPSDRILRDDWGGQPQWKPDERGKVWNNDYFQGDLKGIEQALDRLVYLGVTCIYLNPIAEAHSNHRYDTADYSRVDPLLGTEEDFRSLAKTASVLGIRVILDGVFSHTGADSLYFNKNGRYSSQGAYQSPNSPYTPWYHFRHWPEDYAGWWGFDTLPEVEECEPAFMDYILGSKGIVRQWLAAGAAGWRLDVADELPDAFLEELRNAVKTEDAQALVLGEVWEDASNKESYGHRRRYLLGKQLDSVMNYPFREAIYRFLLEGSGDSFFNKVGDIVENYPAPVLRLLMNPIGTHDTERILTLLAGEPVGGHDRAWQAAHSLSHQQREKGLRLIRLASALQYCLPGVPCIYYGDEAGVEGYKDPFNRGCYPWGNENKDLLHWYHRLGQLRKICPVLADGAFTPVFFADDIVCFERRQNESCLLCAVNRSDKESKINLPLHWQNRTVNLGGGRIEGEALYLPPLDCAILIDNGEN